MPYHTLLFIIECGTEKCNLYLHQIFMHLIINRPVFDFGSSQYLCINDSMNTKQRL